MLRQCRRQRCKKPIWKDGLCEQHYNEHVRWKKGEPLITTEASAHKAAWDLLSVEGKLELLYTEVFVRSKALSTVPIVNKEPETE